MNHWLDHSLVLASDQRVANPAGVRPLLQRRRSALAALGAHHVLVYESTTEPGRTLVMIAIHAREPVLELVRSRAFFDGFDAMGVEDLPAVFAGELVERLSPIVRTRSAHPEVVVCVVTSVEDLATLHADLHDTIDELGAAGVRKLLTFSAFDNPVEVMMLLQIDDEEHAQHWLDYSELAFEWLHRAGRGAYPPAFVGRFVGDIGIDAE